MWFVWPQDGNNHFLRLKYYENITSSDPVASLPGWDRLSTTQFYWSHESDIIITHIELC